MFSWRPARLILTVGVIVLAGSLAPHAATAAPANDAFANRTPLTGAVWVESSNVSATSENGEPAHADQPGGKSVWWSWTATHNSTVRISTAGSGFDTVLAVYTGTAIGSLTPVASNDDASLLETTSLVTFSAVAGTTFQIAVDGIELEEIGVDEGGIRLTILNNDRFSDRVLLTGVDVVVTAHNVGATNEPAEPSHAGRSPMHSVWWRWTAPASGVLTLVLSGDNQSSEAAAFYKRLALYTGDTLETFSLISSHGAAFTLTNHVSAHVVAGATYQIAADGVADAVGRLRLELHFASAPANDNFADRSTVVNTGELVTGSNVSASKEPGEPLHAGDTGGSSVWWSWLAPTNGNAVVEVSGEIASKLVAVYTGATVSNLILVRGQLSAAPTNRLHFDVMAGSRYEIAVDSASGQSGAIALRIQFLNGPVNDAFGDRQVLSGANVTASAGNLGGSAEAGEPNHGGYAAQRSVWWTWTAPTNGSVTVSVSGDNVSASGGPFYKLIGVYTGDSIPSLVTNKLSSGLTLTNRVTFDASAGVSYQVAVDGHNGANGLFSLALVFTSAPANDHFADRLPLSGSSITINSSNMAASKQAGEPNHAGPGGRSVWWTWTAPASGSVSISTTGSTFNTLLAVYRGASVTALIPVASNNDFGGGPASQVTFNAVAGTAYQIAVDGLLQEAGQIRLTLTQAVAPPSPRLEPLPYTGDGSFQFTFLGQANANYFIEGTTNLINWLPITNVVNSPGPVHISDPEASLVPLRFYRVRVD